MVNRLIYTSVRHSHVITTFGPGALSVTENGVTVLTCGPRMWLRSYQMERPLLAETIEDLTIRESHMERHLGVPRIVAPWSLSEDPSPKTDWLIPAVRFPLAEFCRNSTCRRMHTSDRGEWKVGRCPFCKTRGGKSPPTTQVPIVLACQDGHLADVPWVDWVHEGPMCATPQLRYRQTASPRRPTVECLTCGASRSLDDSHSFKCGGERPWLPGLSPDQCDRHAMLVERSSTSIYYADTASSLTIPPFGGIRPVLLRQLRSSVGLRELRAVYEPGSRRILERMAGLCAGIGIATDAEEIERHLAALAHEEERADATDGHEMRRRELDALVSERPRVGRGQGQPDLVVEPIPLSRFGRGPLMDSVSSVSVIPRLREVQVLTGFSRLRAVSPPDGYRQMWGTSYSSDHESQNAGWLPGYEVFGEGILIELSTEAVARWRFNNRDSERLHRYGSGRGLVHTLAHLVMRAAAPISGYMLPSLRERIYDQDGRLAFLIYTTVGDIEGTMGGLAAMGRPGRLEELLSIAIDLAAWCTTDPVCIEASSPPGLARASTTAPGACHHCLLLPETSCEQRNRHLDRALVVGAPGDACGFAV